MAHNPSRYTNARRREGKIALPTAGISVAQEAVLKIKNPEARTFGYRKGLMVWAFVNAFLSLCQTVEIFRIALSGFGWTLDYFVPLSCILQIIAGNALFRLPVRVPVVAVAILIFYGWTVLDGLIINKDIGRTLQAMMGWQTNFTLVYLTLALSLDQATYCGPEIRKWIRWLVLAFCFVSGLYAIGQVAGIGFALKMQLYRGEMAVFRPVGLTDYPSQVAFQGFLGMMLVGSPILKRNLKAWEYAFVFFFALVILCAQYRSMYYGGLAVAAIAMIVCQYRRDRNMGVLFACVFAACVALPLLLFPQKFAYGLRTSKNDPAIQARIDAAKQIGPILSARPLTGLGPDPNFIVSTRLMKIDHWSKHVLDNLYYTILACYGYIGITIACIVLILLIGGISLRWSDTAPDAREWAFIGTVTIISILMFSLTGNSVVYRPVGMNLALVLGVGAFTWREEGMQTRLPGVVVAIRRVMSLPMRLLGIRT